MTLDIAAIMEMIPHRYPMLLIDRIVDFESGVRLRAIKNVSVNEPFFQGHFPGQPIMPGVLILEAMAQASCVLAVGGSAAAGGGGGDGLYLLTGVKDAKFKRPVVPGDQLLIDVVFNRSKRNYAIFDAAARVGEEVAATATLSCVFK